MDDSMEEITIGKGTWIDKVAFTIIEREKKLDRSTEMINVESGLGASGIPHIGSMGDAVRAFGISLALQNMGYKSELIAFSDDLDGLRKVPVGLPEWLNEYLCKPVSSIPDPFGDCHESYGMHMSSLLLEGLDKVGVKYKFKSGTDVYKNGTLFNQVHKILINSKIIGDKISESTGQQKYMTFLPFFPICQQCGRLYVANAIEYFPDEKTISYSCSGNTINKKQIKGCGYQGEVKIKNGGGKLAWKVEFAARWHAFDIRFEAFGKDIMDSVRINDWIASEILRFHHPLHIKYEMFLDKGGKKISKSAGNVLTPQMWLQYGTPESLLLLLYKRIAGTRHIGIDDIPILMDEYDMYEDLYFDKTKEKNKSKAIKIKGIYKYANNLNPSNVPQIHIPYRILIQQSELFIDQKVSNPIEKIYERLKKYGLVKEETPELTNKIQLAMEWAEEFKEVYDDDMTAHADDENGTRIQLENIQKKAIIDVLLQLKIIANELENTNVHIDIEELNQKIQTIIFLQSKENNLEPKDFFKLFYRILINADRGPRLGNYIVDLGIRNVINKIENKIK
ncbi:MAG: lysine--tRNA ligase [Candidatus Nitrosocosmicus sp.]